ncbi:hypothetical protein Sjap_005224 [Stephania japonica]|uniref:Uncharacterized protein n=1 Tax=Stephania japonica TaxID=461633 RepID=A0AAP0K3K1_9MAGN
MASPLASQSCLSTPPQIPQPFPPFLNILNLLLFLSNSILLILLRLVPCILLRHGLFLSRKPQYRDRRRHHVNVMRILGGFVTGD